MLCAKNRRMKLPFTIDSKFIANFKIGDNIQYNASVICELYKNSNDFLIKPKVVFNTALIDAALYDVFRRIKKHTKEFNYLPPKTQNKIRACDIEKVQTFKDHLNKFRHHKILGNYPTLYESLNELNTHRNRIHIQNKNRTLYADEEDVFGSYALQISEKCAEYVLTYISVTYPRPEDYVGGIKLPWNRHFDPANLVWA